MLKILQRVSKIKFIKMGIIGDLKKMFGVSDDQNNSISEVDSVLMKDHSISTEYNKTNGDETIKEMRSKVVNVKKQIMSLHKLAMNSIENVPSQILGSSAIKIALLKAKEGTTERTLLERLQDMNISFDVSRRVAEINVQLLTMKQDSTTRIALEKELEQLNSKGNVGAVYWLFKDTFGLESAVLKQKIKDRITNGWLDKVFLNFEESYNTGKAFEELVFIKDVDSIELIISRLKTSKIEATLEALKAELKRRGLSEKTKQKLEERLKQIEIEFDDELGTLYDSYNYELLNMIYNAAQVNLNSIMNSIDTYKLINEMIKVHHTFFKNS